ncbi:efflux RND transporter periplasmic adaptor subunit [Chitinophaga silvisoli]|uniref:Efflux RND transporter periplasmic adaptor subunit n=1 Tax=Chitinophaga silvisoli TaxID=2291814 RepID=A0A3E1NZE0_9BACT|nr:efflux RND transporter periplasmic adaptor subunit [Chitinophaga silvisoli]RFM33317.1 efflux RND transporter periplasmic adaptor subunit [Chitinophaga silvisoli]
MRDILNVLAGSLIIMTGCHSSADNKEATKNEIADSSNNTVQLSSIQVKNAGIVTGRPELRQMHTSLRVSGVIDVPPQNLYSISIPLGGYLKTMNLLPGSQVKKGQVLAILEDPQYVQLQEDYLVAKSKLAFLEADFARQQELNQSKANSDKVLQQVKSDFESQQVIVRALGEKLHLININPATLRSSNISRQISILAPISGFVSKVNVNTGKYVAPTDVLFELMDPADLHLSLTVFEKDLSQISDGQQVVAWANNSNEKYQAEVHFITKGVDETHAAEVHCHLKKYDKRLVPGMFMNAEIALNNAQVTALPDNAIVKWQGKNYVFKVDTGNTYRMLPVETGAHTDGFTEIKTNLPEGSYVIDNAYPVLMKMKNSGDEE